MEEVDKLISSMAKAIREDIEENKNLESIDKRATALAELVHARAAAISLN